MLFLSWPYGQSPPKPLHYPSLYQRAQHLYQSESADSVALLTYLQTIEWLKTEPGPDSVLLDCHVKAGILAMGMSNNSQALQQFVAAIRLQKKSGRLPDSLLFQPLLYAGSLYYNSNDLDSAQFFYQQAEKLVTKYPLIAESERFYNKEGALYFETGDYTESIQYFTKALQLTESRKPLNLFAVVNYKNNIASALRKQQRYSEAMEIYKSLLPYHLNQNELLHNIGTTYLNAGKFREAIDQLKKTTYANQVKYNEIGFAYLQLKEFDSAGSNFQQALRQFALMHTAQKNLDHGITLKYLGDLRAAERQKSAALDFYQHALIQLDPNFDDSLTTHDAVSFEGLHNFFMLFNTLIAKAQTWQLPGQAKDSLNDLRQSFSTYGAAIRLARQVEHSYNSDEARLFLGSNVQSVYQQIVALGLKLYAATGDKKYLNQAFIYAENSKSSVLQAGIHQLSLASIDGLPQPLIREEKNLRSSITRLNIQSSASQDTALIAQWQRQILDAEIRLSQVSDQLESNPAYHRLKFDSKDVSLDTLQLALASGNTSIVSYYFLPDRLGCFYISKQGYGFRLLGSVDSLLKVLVPLQSALSQPLSHQTSMRNATSALYRQLIEPVYQEISGNTHLIIIPHRELNYLPFEILGATGSAETLLSQFAISYNYSTNFFSPDAVIRSEKKGVLAMAPFAASGFGHELPALPASRNEVEGLKGLSLLDSAATKRRFIESAGDYPVIHLATHAIANDIDPLQSYIEFYAKPGNADTLHRLYEQEIYQLDMQSTRLVILSACETGAGQLVNSEGIMSLSRAFSYAGCKSVITSMWEADDLATAFIGNRVHYYLQKGLRKDEALQHAKLDYLANEKVAPNFKTASYWAHLVLIGDTSPVVSSSFPMYLLWIGIIGLMVAAGIKKAGPAMRTRLTDKKRTY